MINWIKRNPALAFGALVTVYLGFISQATSLHLISGKTLDWLTLVGAVLSLAGGLTVHQLSTSLAAPRDNAGNALVPAPTSTSTPTPALAVTGEPTGQDMNG